MALLTGSRTAYNPCGFGGRRGGSFDGRLPTAILNCGQFGLTGTNGVAVQVGRYYTRYLPYGYGGQRVRAFTVTTVNVIRTKNGDRRPWGVTGRAHGSFLSRTPSSGTNARPFARFTRTTPYGYGGKQNGVFTGRVPVQPGSSGTGSFSLSGLGVTKLVLGDQGGPYYELGEFQLSGSGLAVIQTGQVVASGTGTFAITGSGDAVAVSEGEITATGDGSFALSGTGTSFGPDLTATGSGNFALFGAGAGHTQSPVIGGGGITIDDIKNSILNAEVEPGITVLQALKILLAEAAGETVGNPEGGGNFGYRAAGSASTGTIRLQGNTDGLGGRTAITLNFA